LRKYYHAEVRIATRLFGAYDQYFISCLAAMAQNLSLTDRGRARRLGELSLKVSLVGIIVTVVAALILGGVCRGTHRCWDRSYPTTSNCSGYEIEGLCYSHRRSVFMLPNCQKSFDTCCHPSEDMYYRQYCYTLMNFDQQGTF
jgi:hypothetical protein